MQGSDGKAGDAVKGKAQHFAQRVVALPCNPLRAFIIDTGAFEAHQWEHAPQEQVHFLKRGEFLQNLAGYQPIIGMVIHRFHAHRIQQLVVALGGKPFEEGIGIPFTSDTVDNLAAVQIGIHHGVHGADVILSVAVNGNGDIAFILGLHEPCQHCVLVAPVAALANAGEVAILPGKVSDNLPGSILGAVVDEQYLAVGTDFFRVSQRSQLAKKHGGSNGKNCLLVIAGDHNIQDRCCHKRLLLLGQLVLSYMA